MLSSQFRSITVKIFLVSGFWFLVSGIIYAQEDKKEPIIVDGDKVEYLTESKEMIAVGNVEVNYKGVKLTCDKLILNTETKDGVAEGNARLEEQAGVIEAPKMIYNFQTKTGLMIDSEFRSNPYFGKAQKVKKVSETEFIAFRGKMSTCSLDRPHYHFKSRKIDFFMQDKIQTKDDTIYVGKIPLFYLPQYNHSLKDPLVHVQLMPGKTKDWGAYLLTAWRYSLAENVGGRIYFDYREQLGVAEGFGLNYTTHRFGKGDYKYYYTQERSRRFREGEPAEFQRYLIRWRHQWNIDENTDLTSEYYKIVDSKRMLYGSQYNLLKDYFYREYERDTQPQSYTLINHRFSNSTLNMLLQKRVNRWYSMTEKLPEIKYTLPSLQVAKSPFYFENISSFANLNQKNAVPSPSYADVTENKFDTTHKVSLPMKIAFINMTPSISGQQVYSDNSTYGSTLQLNFGVGSDASTKFYRILNVKSNFLGLDINGLRHIITPTIGYLYSKNSTMPSSNLRIGGGASTSNGSPFSLELSNKLQTKRKNKTVDLANFRVKNTYTLRSKTDVRKSGFADFLFDLELLPYAWMRMNTEAKYNHLIDAFSEVNADITFDLGGERSIGFGQRYQRKGGKEFTFNMNWRLNPKWKFGIYERLQFARIPGYKRGLREQQFFIARDLHCWTMEITYNVLRERGESIWLIFRLKAFPELEFEYNQSYHQPKPGSQS